MARGRLLKTKIKEAKAIAIASTLGEIKGKLEGLKKFGIGSYLNTWLEKASIEEVVKIGVFASTTYLVYNVLSKAETLTGMIKNLPVSMVEQITSLASDVFTGNLLNRYSSKPIKDEKPLQFDVNLMLVSVMIAYLIVYKQQDIKDFVGYARGLLAV